MLRPCRSRCALRRSIAVLHAWSTSLNPAGFLARESGAFSGRMRPVQLGRENRRPSPVFKEYTIYLNALVVFWFCVPPSSYREAPMCSGRITDIGANRRSAKAGSAAFGPGFCLGRAPGFGGGGGCLMGFPDQALQFALCDIRQLHDHVAAFAPHMLDEHVGGSREQKLFALIRQKQVQTVRPDHCKDSLFGPKGRAAEMIHFSNARKREREFADICRTSH